MIRPVTDDHVAGLVSHAHAGGVLNLAAAALLEHHGRFLLIRAAGPASGDTRGWELPTGGIRAGESVLDGLERMLRDRCELTLDEVAGYLGHNDHPDGTRVFCFAVTCTNPETICHYPRIGHHWTESVHLPGFVKDTDHLLRSYYS